MTASTADPLRTLYDALAAQRATRSPGAAQVMAALRVAFPSRGGVPATVRACCRSGALRPTLLRPRSDAGNT